MCQHKSDLLSYSEQGKASEGAAKALSHALD